MDFKANFKGIFRESRENTGFFSPNDSQIMVHWPNHNAIPTSIFVSRVFLKHNHPQLFTHCLTMLSHYSGRVEYLFCKKVC